MISFIARIKDPVGLHARPASLVVGAASKFEADITIHAGHAGKKVGNLKSIMNVMALGIKNNEEIRIEASGIDADKALEAIKKVMKDNHLI